MAFLTWYGVSSLLRARRTELAARPRRRATVRAAVRPSPRRCALTWLNPHVYLDTVLLLGSIAHHARPDGRWWFALGAGVASLAWFAGLGYGARLRSRLLASRAPGRCSTSSSV